MPPLNQTTAQIGHSKGSGFVGLGEDLPATDVSGDIACVLRHQIKPTTLYIKPWELLAKMEKYGSMLQVPDYHLKRLANLAPKPLAAPIRIPATPVRPVKSVDTTRPAAVVIPPKPVPIGLTLYTNAVPVIDLCSGIMYPSSVQAAKAVGCSEQLLRASMRKPGKRARGRLFRPATIDELTDAAMNPNWKFKGKKVKVGPCLQK